MLTVREVLLVFIEKGRKLFNVGEFKCCNFFESHISVNTDLGMDMHPYDLK